MSALTLAIPSKGRLQEQVAEYFADAGMAMKKAAGARGYRATLTGQSDIDVMLLSASEIAAGLLAGDVHLGVTGEDLIRESAPELVGRITLLAPLGFGFANVVVAVPQAWIDVSTMADLDDVCAAFTQRHKRRLRIATKYVHLTRAFFAHAGIADYRIVESAGATEGAPTAGTAEAIVDITTTGATLAASLTADWNEAAREAAKALLARLSARERAKASHVLRVRLDDNAESIIATLAKAGASLLSRPAAGNAAGEYSILCPRPQLMEAMASLGAHGSGASATVHDVDYVFADVNPFYEKLAAALPR